NTVRNVTACSLAGVCQREAFDVAPYAAAVGSHFLRSPLVQALPRKFKIAFSGCATDCAYAPVHDVGAIAVLREEGNTLHRGFRIFVGGGLGAIPRLGEVLSDFLPEEELVPTIEAILRVFNRLGERGNREHARMKFLLRRLGVEEFRRLVGEELRQIEASSRRFYWPPVAGASGESTAPQAPWEPGVASPEFQRWMETNVVPQKQPGYFAVHIVVPLGDLTADQFRALADMARDFALGEIRTTNQQDIVLPWVRGESLLRLYEALIKAALGSPGAGRVCDVTCCQGADTCSVGLTRSKGLARALLDELQKRGDSHTLAVKIKMSGCPHSCGQHHIADIGLHGCAVHNNGRLAPCYQLLMGGGIGDKGARLVQPVMKIPSKRVPAAISRVLDYYREAHLSGEGFTDFFWRVGVEEIRERLSDFKVLPRIEEDPMSYVDWGAFTLFTLEERGEGECAV
ncbi:MAG: nitrite/sulfite reductase, partial [Chloroflexi bacterium]|nr:nitrite/sulfite reductase [Chloroflexota bacterium]